MKYGLPYKGSKNKLAERIVSLLPQADHLVDLFCGGCAVTHAALLRRKWPHVHINDIDWRPVTLFRDALAGRYQDETRWISREDFQRLKDTDPYVAVVWSFGNNMRDYLYSQDIEPLKRAIHYAMFYGDYEPARELGHDLSFIQPIDDLQKRYLAVKHYFSRLGHFQQQLFEGGAELDCSPGISREIQLESWNRGGADLPLIPSDGQPNCNTWNVATEWGSFKKKKNSSESTSTTPSSDETTCYRLQYRERHRSLPVVGGGRNGLYSHRPSATTATSRYPTAPSSTATFPTRARMSTTSLCSSTTKPSTTGAGGRRNPSSSAATTCPPTVSAASRRLPIAPRCRHRPTTKSPSASSSPCISSRPADPYSSRCGMSDAKAVPFPSAEFRTFVASQG